MNPEDSEASFEGSGLKAFVSFFSSLFQIPVSRKLRVTVWVICNTAPKVRAWFHYSLQSYAYTHKTERSRHQHNNLRLSVWSSIPPLQRDGLNMVGFTR